MVYSYLVGSNNFLDRWPGYERKTPLCVPTYVHGTSFKMLLERFFHVFSINEVISTSGLQRTDEAKCSRIYKIWYNAQWIWLKQIVSLVAEKGGTSILDTIWLSLPSLSTLAYHNHLGGEKPQFGRRMKAQAECRRLLHLWLGGRLQAGYWKSAHATMLITSSSNNPTCVEDTINSRMVMTLLAREHFFTFKRLKKK